ncbi:hypothetical protein ES703_33354 [subsurface metagenome]
MLTDAEYRHAKAGQSALQGKIDALERDEDEYDRLKKNAHDAKVPLVDEMAFYTNFMKESFEEYEAAHQPETP